MYQKLIDKHLLEEYKKSHFKFIKEVNKSMDLVFSSESASGLCSFQLIGIKNCSLTHKMFLKARATLLKLLVSPWDFPQLTLREKVMLATMGFSLESSSRACFVDMRKRVPFDKKFKPTRISMAKPSSVSKKVFNVLKNIYNGYFGEQRNLIALAYYMGELVSQVVHKNHIDIKVSFEILSDIASVYGMSFIESCMTDNPEGCLDNIACCGTKVALSRLEKNGAPIARALVWEDVAKISFVGSEHKVEWINFVDRVYSSDGDSANAVREDMAKKVESQIGGRTFAGLGGIANGLCLYLKIVPNSLLPLKHDGYDEEYFGYPYMDTFCNISHTYNEDIVFILLSSGNTIKHARNIADYIDKDIVLNVIENLDTSQEKNKLLALVLSDIFDVCDHAIQCNSHYNHGNPSNRYYFNHYMEEDNELPI